MTWDYWTWIRCSVSVSAAIFFITLVALWLLLLENDTIFYGIVAKLLNIERCFIDAHHNIVRKDEKINLNRQMVESFLVTTVSLVKGSDETSEGGENDTPNPTKPSFNRPSNDQNSYVTAKNGTKNNKSVQESRNSWQKPELDPEHQREILNVYGRYISVHKRGSQLFVVILTTIIIAGALIAAFNNLILYATSIYRDSPCPSIGPMECFCGNNNTYFTCDTGKINPCPFDVHVGACFRWTAHDLTTSDITTQLGVTAGLLVALGNITQAIIRIYLLAFNKRLSIATGINRIAAKTIGINGHTASTKCCWCRLPCHCSPCNLSLFKHPSAVIIVTVIYIAIPILMIPGVALLYVYEISVTSLTFVILIIFAVICMISIVWIMVQESEASSNIPGGWNDIRQMINSITTDVQNTGENNARAR